MRALVGVALHREVHLLDQRACGVDHVQAALGGGFEDRFGDAVGAEDHVRSGRGAVEIVDEYGSFVAQSVDHVLVVDDFVADVHGRAELLDGALDDLDGALDTGAEAARSGEKDSLGHIWAN